MVERKEDTEKQGVIFAIVEENKIILEKRLNPNKSYFGLTIIPGGKVEAGESIEDALIREIKEETELVPVSWKYLTSLGIVTEKGNKYLHNIYLITKTKGTFVGDKEDDSLLIRVPFEQANNLCGHPFSRLILQLIEKELLED